MRKVNGLGAVSCVKTASRSRFCFYVDLSGSKEPCIRCRACLDQLLITIRLFTLLCDHSRSKTRLIAIMNLIAKLRIIYATACHASLCTTTTECQLSLLPHSAYYYIQTWHGEGEVGISESVAAAAGALGLCKLLCWLPLIASRNTPFLPCSAPPTGQPTHRRRPYTTLMSHCQHSGLLR